MEEAPKVAEYTLGGFQDFFAGIYDARNTERFGDKPVKGISSMWLRVITHSGEVARAVRKRNVDLLLRELPKVFCWYCTFCSKLNIDLDEAIWLWFPRVCPTCYKERCGCGGSKEKESIPQKSRSVLDRFARENYARRPRTADEYVGMFGEIYGNYSGSVHIDGIFLHFMEELSEVAELIQHVKILKGDSVRYGVVRSKLEAELADVFSWIAKLCWSTNQEFQGFLSFLEQGIDGERLSTNFGEITLSGLVEIMYREGCPYCRVRPCSQACPGWIGT